MANEGYLIQLQGQIDYTFKDVTFLERALTAPGVEGDKEGNRVERDKYDGNRKLAQLGESVLQLIVLDKSLYEEEAERSSASEALKSAALKENHEKRARFFKIDTHMKLSPRQRGRASLRTLSLAVCAIFGACFKDSGKTLCDSLTIALESIGADLEDSDRYVDPLSTYRQDHFILSQLVTDVFEDPSDDASSQGAFGSPPVMVDNELGIVGNASSRITGLRASDEWEIRTTGLDNSSVQSPWDNESTDEGRFHNIANHEQPSDIRWDRTSASQTSLRSSSVNTHRTSNASSMEFGMYENIFHTVSRTSTSDIDGSMQDISKESPLVRSQMRTRATRHPYSTQRLNTSDTSARVEHRKRLKLDRNKSASLEEYILLEKARCQSLGLPCPEEIFNSAVSQASNNSTRLDEIITDLKVFYFAIASPESLVALQAILKVHRRSLEGRFSVPKWRLTLAERMKEIENLGKKIGYIALLRRCHIYQLYLDCSVDSQKTSDGFINNTTQSISTRPRTEIGNPKNLDDSRIAKLIMKEIYPDVEITSPGYKSRLRFFGKMRKLGQRLDLLVEKFGYGILGLLPLAIDVPAMDPVLNITDALILKIPDDTFRWFIQCLEQLQGDLLRRTSEATCEIVTAIFQGTLDHSKRFGIEQLGQEEIVKHPRGSSLVLESISKDIPNIPMQRDLHHLDV